MISQNVEGIQNAMPGPRSVTALKQHRRGVTSGNSQTISSWLVEDNKKELNLEFVLGIEHIAAE